MMGNFAYFCRLLIFCQNNFFQKNRSEKNIRVSNSFDKDQDLDQARHWTLSGSKTVLMVLAGKELIIFQLVLTSGLARSTAYN